jgi:hypothetical protein
MRLEDPDQASWPRPDDVLCGADALTTCSVLGVYRVRNVDAGSSSRSHRY